MQNKNSFQIKILRKKNQKSFKLTPLQSIFYLCQFYSLNLLKFRISKRDNFRLKNWDEFYPKKLKILWKRNQFPQIVV